MNVKENMTFEDWVQVCLLQYDISVIEGVTFRYFEDHIDWNYSNANLFVDLDFVQLT